MKVYIIKVIDQYSANYRDYTFNDDGDHVHDHGRGHDRGRDRGGARDDDRDHGCGHGHDDGHGDDYGEQVFHNHPYPLFILQYERYHISSLLYH